MLFIWRFGVKIKQVIFDLLFMIFFSAGWLLSVHISALRPVRPPIFPGRGFRPFGTAAVSRKKSDKFFLCPRPEKDLFFHTNFTFYKHCKHIEKRINFFRPPSRSWFFVFFLVNGVKPVERKFCLSISFDKLLKAFSL